LGPPSLFYNGRFGAIWIKFKALGADGSSGGFGWWRQGFFITKGLA
jgi:hypothetical protein